MTKGGQVKEVVSASKVLVKTSGDIVNDLATGLATVVGGLTNGLEIVAGKTGNTLKKLSHNLAVASTKVFRRVGDLGLNISKHLGKVVEIVPILGIPTAYVVKGAGKGIYYVVTTVGDVTGKSLKTVGNIGEQLSNVVVFTIVSTSNLTEKTLKEAGKIVQKVTHLVNNKKTRRRHHPKKRRTSKSKLRK